MKMIPIQSSNLRAIGYDQENATLAVEFHSGVLHHHGGVPAALYVGLMSAPSHGKYYNEHIKGQYPGRRAGETPVPQAEEEPTPQRRDPARMLEEAIARFKG